MKYEPGMMVKIRNWEDMASDFGLIDGDIGCPFLFTEKMRKFCGNIYTIQSNEPIEWFMNSTYRLCFKETDGIENYKISSEMVVPIADDDMPDDIIIPDISMLF